MNAWDTSLPLPHGFLQSREPSRDQGCLFLWCPFRDHCSGILPRPNALRILHKNFHPWGSCRYSLTFCLILQLRCQEGSFPLPWRHLSQSRGVHSASLVSCWIRIDHHRLHHSRLHVLFGRFQMRGLGLGNMRILLLMKFFGLVVLFHRNSCVIVSQFEQHSLLQQHPTYPQVHDQTQQLLQANSN